MKRAINVSVNGVSQQHEVEPRLLLVHYLRDLLGLTGTHIGCETSLCGACTIFVAAPAINTSWKRSSLPPKSLESDVWSLKSECQPSGELKIFKLGRKRAR